MFAFGHNRNLIKSVHQLNHFFGAAGAAVAVAEHIHCLTTGVFIYIGFPVLLNLRRHVPCDKMRRRHTGINLAAVYASPYKVIMGKTVGVIPC